MTDLLLLLDGASEPPPSVSFSASLSFLASGTATLGAQITYAADADLDAQAAATFHASTSFAAAAALDSEATNLVENSRILFEGRATFAPTLRPRGKKRRTVIVDDVGGTYGELENASHGSITWELNKWQEAAFALPLADPKSVLVLEERIREVQLWRGDRLLSFGPMVRPATDKANLGVSVKGPAWHLSRRHVGKANRENRLTNGSFENGLAGWSFLRGAHFLDYQPLEPGQVTIHSPAKAGARALAIRSDLEPWYTPPAIVDAPDSVHVVVTGDTLWDLASSFYGSGLQWRRIYDANAALIEADARTAGLWDPRDPGHWIFPGQNLTIPGIPSAQTVDPPPDANTLWGDTFAYQELEVSGGVRGLTATLTAWAYVRSDEFEDYGAHERGVLLSRLPTDYRTDNPFADAGINTWGGRRGYYSENIEVAQSTIDEEHPFDRWVRHETEIFVPPGKTEILHARLNAVQGLTIWDLATLTFDDAFEAFDTDQATIVADLVDHAQDAAFDKSDVNLEVEGPPKTGVKKTLVALHSEHANVWDLIEDFTTSEDGIDLSEELTPTSRKLRIHYPAQGLYKPKLALRLNRNVEGFAWAFDGEAASSSVIVLGTGDGSDREEASAIDPTAFAGGLTLEEVFSVPPDTPIELLENIAVERLAVVSAPEVLTVTTFPHSDDLAERNLFGRLLVGDTTDVVIRRGGLSIEGIYRVVRLTLRPDDRLELVLNRREF